MAIDYRGRIPNNVDLGENGALQRALEHWQPHFLGWWKEMGPATFAGADVYLRTATTIDEGGWATTVWSRCRNTGVAAGPGRAPLGLAPANRHPGRHRAGLGRAATPARPHMPLALRSAQPLPGQCRGRPSSVGDGVSAPRLFWPRRPRGGR